MDGRAFLDVAERLALRQTEEDWRTSAGRAYYGLFQECRAALEDWGYVPASGEQVHRFVRLHFAFPADADLKAIGQTLEDLGRLRNQADYQLGTPGAFATAKATRDAVVAARKALALRDAIVADAQRRATAVAAVQAAFP
jgi:hypothetical protein